MIRSGVLPGQAHYQGLELLAIQCDSVALAQGAPHELALVQSACGQPKAIAVMYQHLHPIGALVGKNVGAVRFGFAKRTHYPCEGGIRPRAHVQRLTRQPDLVHPDHGISALSQFTDSIIRSIGQWTTRPPGRSMQMVERVDSLSNMTGTGNWMKSVGP